VASCRPEALELSPLAGAVAQRQDWTRRASHVPPSHCGTAIACQGAVIEARVHEGALQRAA